MSINVIQSCLRLMALVLTTMFALLGAGYAAAQTSAVPYGPQRNVDERFRNQVFKITPEQKLSDALMSGQGDLLLLKRTPLITAHASYQRSFTSNGALSPEDPVKDTLGVAEAGVEIATVVAGHVRVYATAGVASAAYSGNKNLDYSAVTASVGATVHYAGVDLDLAYAPSVVYGANFRHVALKQARFGAELSTNVTFGPLTVQPSVHYNKTRAHPSDYDNSVTGARLTLVLPLKTKRPITLYASGGYERRVYDHYFPDLLGLDRRDKLRDAAIGARWQVLPKLDLSASYSYQNNRSTSDVSGYKARGGLIGVSLNARF